MTDEIEFFRERITIALKLPKEFIFGTELAIQVLNDKKLANILLQ
jgi:hypothetical protein